MMGFDVWGGDCSEHDYLELCSASQKYAQGSWHVLFSDNELVSSIIEYQNCWGLDAGYLGFGSVCTAPQFRRQGYASLLLSHRIQNAKALGFQGIYLFSDIDPALYEKLGFEIVAGCEEMGMMFLSLGGRAQVVAPSYF